MSRASHLSIIAFAALSPGIAGCRDPRADANIAQAMMDAGSQISMLLQDQSLMQSQLDSLLQVVAWQDTIIRRLASHTGLPMPSR